MILTGHNLIAGAWSADGSDTFYSVDPATGDRLGTEFFDATEAEVDSAVRAAADAAVRYRRVGAAKRRTLLHAIADAIVDLGQPLIERCVAETGLPAGRITGERGRTVHQLRLFAEVAGEGSWVDARIDRGDPDRQPVPKPDVRSMLRPLGPVGIFGAGNFPLAFSVAGGDTASALAAGCPVVCKAHPGHAGTCELIGRAIAAAVDRCGMPTGMFSLLQGHTHDSGGWLVTHPLIRAIGFTGSYRGGKALFDAAVRRPVPIPVYAEMGSTNPIFILPGALEGRGAEIARGLVQSVTLGVGQFCTNPGLVFLPDHTVTEQFKQTVAEQIREVKAAVMLNEGTQLAYERGVAALQNETEVVLLAEGPCQEEGYRGTARVFATAADRYLQHSELEEEVFGPSTVLVTTDSREQLLASARTLRGHLTASLFADPDDLEDYRELFEILEQKAGRLLINAFPTGVEVGHAMVHGGPFPATTASGTSSVGTRAIVRFARPVCYQNVPAELLPAELRDDNPLSVRQLLDGKYK